MAQYEVVHDGAGPFTKGQVVTEQDVADAKHDLQRFIKLGAVKEVSGKDAKDADAPDRQVAHADDPGRSPENTTGAPRKDVSTAALAPARPADPKRK